MRSILIGTVGSTELVLKAMQESGHPPAILATFDTSVGPRRHADYVDLSPLAGPETVVVNVDNINDPATIERLAEADPDVIFVVGWSQIVGPNLRALARRFCVGFHPTLLPALRGRAAIGWTILLGLEETGASLFVIDEDVDDGPLLAQIRFALDPRETVASLMDKHGQAMKELIHEALPRIAEGTLEPEPQSSEGVSYIARRTAEDSLIDWTSTGTEIDRLVRASSRPYAGAFCFTRKRRITIWSAEPYPMQHPYFAAAGQIVTYEQGQPVVRCGDGTFLLITEYECEGGRPLVGQVRLRNRLDG